jgi:hypothetical protein
MTGIHFLSCKCRGTDKATRGMCSEVVQVAFAYLKYAELKFSGSTSSVDSNLVGISAKGNRRHTDGQPEVWGGGGGRQ